METPATCAGGLVGDAGVAQAEQLLGPFERHSAPRLVLPTLVLVLIAYVPGPALMLYWFTRDLWSGAGRTPGRLWPAVLLLLAYALGFVLLMFYVVLGPLRTTIVAEGVRVRTWRGWRMFCWRDVQAAKITSHKGMTATLVLSFGGLRRVRICLNDYRKGRSLFEAIRRQLPVPVQAYDSQLAILRDE